MLLPQHALQRIARALEPDAVPVVNCSPEKLLDELDAPGDVCLVLDPTRLDSEQLENVAASLRATPRPVVIYTPLTPEGVQTGLGLARDVGGLVAFQATEEDFRLLVHNILSVGHPADARFVLDHLAPRLELLPDRLRDAIVSMFTMEAGVTSPQTLARHAATSRRSVDRWLERAGISSARLLVGAPKLLRALRLLSETRLPLRRIATACGYSSARRFHDQALALTGLAPLELRRANVSMGDVLLRVATALQDNGPTSHGEDARMNGSAAGRASDIGSGHTAEARYGLRNTR